MGIQGLLRFLKDATSEIHIREYAGRCVAVDTYCWLHRGAFACADKLAKGEKTDQYVKYCMKFVDMLESFNVRPILVFDGCHLPSKKEVEKQRRERRELYMQKGKQFLREGRLSDARDAFTKCVSVTPQMALAVMKVARERGVDCIVAPYEADAQLAYLLKQGYAQAVVTEDSDLLCFGCERVILKMDLTGRAQEVSLDKLDLVKNLQGFTIDKFRHMCILSGCDYLPSIKGIGLAKSCKALKISKNKDIYQMVGKLHQYIKGLAPVEPEYAAGFERADKTFLYQLVVDPKHRKIIPLNPYPPDINQDEVKYAGPIMSDSQALHIAWGNIDINTGKRIGDFDADKWLRSKNWNGGSTMKRSSIWQKDFFSQNKPSESLPGRDKTKKLKEPEIISLRGKEAVIDMKMFSYTSKIKKKEELIGEEKALEEVLTQQPDDNGDNKKLENKKIQKESENKLSEDQIDLLDVYKAAKPTIANLSVPKKSTDKLSIRQRMRQSNGQMSTNCVVKSRFFSSTDDNPSFIEESEEQSTSTLTHIDETPETSNSSVVLQPMASDEGALDEILQEIATEVKVHVKQSPIKRSIHSIKSPKKQKQLLEKLQQFQKLNHVRSPLIPTKTEKRISITPLKRKNPFAQSTQENDETKPEYSIYNKRKSSSPHHGTPACLKKFKRRVVKPCAIDGQSYEDVSSANAKEMTQKEVGIYENLDSNTIFSDENPYSIAKDDNCESEEKLKLTSEDIPIIDDHVSLTKNSVENSENKTESISEDKMADLKLRLTPNKLIVSLKKLSPENVSYEEFISTEKFKSETIADKKNILSETIIPQHSSEPIVLSSDEENIPYIDARKNMPKKRQRTIGLNRNTPPQSSSGLIKSKYFGGAKASGLKKKESIKSKKIKKSPITEDSKNQPKITSLFSRSICQPSSKKRKVLSPKLENSFDKTPENDDTDVDKIKLKMMATRKLFGQKIK